MKVSPSPNSMSKTTDRLSTQNRLSSTETTLGRVIPQAIDLEEAVLGAMMLEQSAVNAVIDVLRPDSFYKPAHSKIFDIIQNLFNDSEPIDLLTVTEALRKSGDLELVGGAFTIANLTTRIASTANVEFHARIISQKHIQRELIRVSSNIIEKAFDEKTDVFDLLDEAESGLFEVAEGNIRKSYESMSSVVKKAIDNIDNARSQDGGVSGVPSGFTDLDKLTGGWQRSDMIVLAARPGMGKTAFVLTMARNIAVDHDIPVAVFSLEMSSVQLVQRLIAAETGISSDKFRKGTLEDHEYQQLHDRIGKLSKAPLFIDDTPGLNVFELRAKCRRLVAQNIKYIKQVIPQNSLDYTENLLKIKPDYVVHGDDWKNGVQKKTRANVIKVIKKWSGKLIEPKYTKNISSSIVKNRIQKINTQSKFSKSKLKRISDSKKITKIIEYKFFFI